MPALKKYIIVVAPHTSNWDFMLGLCVRSILRFDAKYLGKKELFRFPFGGFMKWLGGVPVDRSRHGNLVDAVAELFRSDDSFIVAIAPEGTRRYVEKWKTGFYYMAMKAGVPIVPASFDYRIKTIYIGQPFYPTGNLAADMQQLLQFFRDKRGKYEKKLPEVISDRNISK